MKKIIALLLAATMLLSLAACGSSNGGETQKPAVNSPATNENNATEAYVVDLAFPTMQAIPSAEAIQQVEDAINAHIVNNLGITDVLLNIDFRSLTDYQTVVGMELASGAKMDIFLTTDLPTYVTNGYMTDLTPYLDNEMAGAKEVIEDWLSCGTVDGTVYAIPCYKGQVLSWKYFYDKAITDGVYDMSTVDSFDDLDAVFEALKEAHPDEYFGAYTNQYPTLYAFEDHTSVIGTYFATVGDDPTVVNYFATDAFRKGIEKAYEHRQKGWVEPEGSANTQTHDALVMSGAVKGVIMGHAYSVETAEKMFTMNNSYGAEFGAVEIARSDMSTNTLTYGIAYTSENPAAAAKMMNLIWTDEVIASSLIYGLEGISWEWNEDHTSIQYPEGLGLDTVPYTALYTCGAFGNQFLLYGFDGNTSEEDKVFMKELIDEAWYPPLFGFIPNSSPVATQVAAISNVYDQYFDPLTYGDVDPEEFLPQFLDALEAAGINDVIAEYNAQAQAWLKANG